ncbi:MAG: hypothetical protein JRF02_01650 [Deltaproteobacteria bacterium]|jgi:hypothetical protein|nr:hypothetical protein [Deltaproteobacteria bacterium]
MRKTFYWAVYVIIPITAILIIVFLMWESISYYTFIKVAQFYAGKARIHLEINKLSGTPLSKTTIEKISLRPQTGQPQTYHFKAQQIICSYNIWDLQKGYDHFLQKLHCTAEAPEFFYEFRAVVPMQQGAVLPADRISPLTVLPSLSVQNGKLSLAGSGWNAEAKAIDFSLVPKVSGPELHFEAGRILLSQSGVTRFDTRLTSRLRLVGDKFLIDSFELGEEGISAKGYLDLSRMAENLMEFSAELVSAASKVTVSGALENRVLHADIRTDNFNIDEIQRRLGGTGWDISGNISGEADITYNLTATRNIAGSFLFHG